jgi:succinoglycan biosynthesis transport protein ExoP
MQSKLVIVSGPDQGETRLLDGNELSIGRQAPSDWQLRDDTISRQQCVLRRQNGRYLLIDFQSHNGSFVNGALVRQITLQNGDKIRLGRTELLFFEEKEEAQRSWHQAERQPNSSRRDEVVHGAAKALSLTSCAPNKMAGPAKKLGLAVRSAHTVPARTRACGGGAFARTCKAISRPKRTILTLMVLTIAAAFAVQFLAPKIYESTAIVTVERHASNGVMGRAGTRLLSIDDMDQVIATEIEISHSDPVLRPVAEQFDLLAVEKQFSGVDTEQVRRQKSEADIQLKHLQVARSANSDTMRITYRANDPQLAANVANAVAQSLVKQSDEAAKRSFDQIATTVAQSLPDLVAKMDTSAKSLAEFERQLNMADPEQRVAMLSARVAELNTQLAATQNERIRREAILGQVNASDTLAAAQTASRDNSLTEAQQRLNVARQQFAMARSYYGERHPEYAKAQKQEQELEGQIRELQSNAKNQAQAEFREAESQEARLSSLLQQTKVELEKLQASAHQYENLKNEAQSDKDNYNRLAAQARSEAIEQQIHDVSLQMTSPARPAQQPFFPNLPINLGVAIVGSGLLGMAVTLFGKSMDPSFYGPNKGRNKINLAVLASLPTSKSLQNASTPNGISLRAKALLTENTAEFEEGIRELRAALMLITNKQQVRNVLMTSATAGEGKSTAAAHLAVASAQAGQRVLLIDANLRRPALHNAFGIANTIGLSEVLKGERPYSEAIVETGEQGVFLMPAGQVSRRAADLIGIGLSTVLAKTSRVFDLVIVDAPAILGASESLQMAGAVDGVLLLTKAGATTEQDVSEVLSNLSRARANVLGLVMNQIQRPDLPKHDVYQYPEATCVYTWGNRNARYLEVPS